ncbi:hypothetical protein NQ315_003319 [Exocentrus adspersus]|uniref:HTH psq-type domain-containing protein n=1 Tax=Exocentrus adspersus TaxID=1586481 RepID=A0AAV8VCR7_9CUCU|nr:hypothetical protein NQ315_003319 [Exocentrus adspersus]
MQRSIAIPRIETADDLEAAVVSLETDIRTALEQSTTMRRASEFYGVPYTTLNHHFTSHNRHPLPYGGPRSIELIRSGHSVFLFLSKSTSVTSLTVTGIYRDGGQPVLDRECENLLLNALQTCAQWGFPLKPINIREIVQQFLNKRGVFPNNVFPKNSIMFILISILAQLKERAPVRRDNITEKRFQDNLLGEGWFKGFMARHPELTLKMAENTKRLQAAVTYESVEEYFRNLRDNLPQNCVNYDETNFVDNPGAVKVMMKKGSKHAYRTLDTSKFSITLMFAIASNGARLPPTSFLEQNTFMRGGQKGD